MAFGATICRKLAAFASPVANRVAAFGNSCRGRADLLILGGLVFSHLRLRIGSRPSEIRVDGAPTCVDSWVSGIPLFSTRRSAASKTDVAHGALAFMVATIRDGRPSTLTIADPLGKLQEPYCNLVFSTDVCHTFTRWSLSSSNNGADLGKRTG